MAVTRERFEQGMTLDAYRQQMTRNREAFEANEQKLVLGPDDIEPFTRLPQPLNVLVLGEDWCTDVVDNLPVLGRLAAASGKLNVRIFLRDQNADLADQFLKDGQFRSIPVFAFFDEQFREVGRFIERPASVTARRAAIRRELCAEHPEFGTPETPISQLPEDVRVHLMQLMAERRETTKAEDNRDVIRDLREIAERVHAQ